MVLYDEKFGYGGESFGSSESNTSGTTGTDTQSFSDGPEAVETTVDAGAANASAGNDDAVKTSVADPFKEEQFANKTRIFGNAPRQQRLPTLRTTKSGKRLRNTS